MKIIFLMPFILLLVLSVNVFSETKFSINSTSVWRVDHIRNGVSDEESHTSGDDISKYFFSGDTLINSKLYYKLFKTGTSYFDVPFFYEMVYKGALREENNKFFYVDKDGTGEIMLYNFDAVIGETIEVPYDGILEEKVVSSIDTLYDGRKLIHFNPKDPIIGCGDQYIIEGIGGSGGLLEGPACNHFWTSDNHLVCYVQDNMLIYHDNNFQFNCDVIEPITSYLDSTCVWRVDKQVEEDTCSDFEKLIYFINGDTLINNNRYFRLYKTGYQLQIHENGTYFSGYNDSVYTGALLEKNNSFYFIEKGETLEKLLYNFNLDVGEEVDGDIYRGDTIKTVGAVLDNRKIFYLSDNYWEKTLIQGIGSDKGLLESKNENSLLVCFMKNNTSVFHSGTGSECALTFTDLSFSYGDILKVIPANPTVNDNIKLVSRLLYSVSFDHPVIPVKSTCETVLEDNSFNIQLTYGFDDQDNLGETKMLVPVFDTIQIGNLPTGDYFIELAVNMVHHGTVEDSTVEDDRFLYSSFTVSTTDAIIHEGINNEIRVYPVSSDHLVKVENLNHDHSIQFITVYNLLGERVQNLAVPNGSDQSSFQVDLGNYQKGIYLLKINGNGINLTKKIVLE